ALERYAGRLAPLDRAYLAWVLATCRGDGAEALRAARAMTHLAPASEALYLVAEDAMALNRPREAADALMTLGPDRGFTRGWWVYWYDLTTALHLLGDHRRELKQALEGVRRFPDHPQSLTTEGRALAAPARRGEARLRGPRRGRAPRPERLARGRRGNGRRVGPDGLSRVPGRGRRASGEPRPGVARGPDPRAGEAALSVRPAHRVAGADS